MIENLQEKLHQGERKQSKDSKICASIKMRKMLQNFQQNVWKTKYATSSKYKAFQLPWWQFLNQLKSF